MDKVESERRHFDVGISTNRYIREPKVKFKPQAIDQIVSGGLLGTEGDSFEDTYQSTPLDSERYIERKYAIAWNLIQDGRYGNPEFLLKEFYPTHPELRSQSKAVDPEVINLQNECKRNLQLLLIEKGIISPFSKEAEGAEEEIINIANKNETLKQLREILEPADLSMIMTMEMYGNVSDSRKLEEIRRWIATKALLRPYLGDIQVQKPTGGDIGFPTIMNIVPESIFISQHEAMRNIAIESFKRRARSLFILNPQTGFEKLELMIQEEQSLYKRRFLENTYREFKKVDSLSVPDCFVTQLPGWFTESSRFPLFHQKLFVHEFLESQRKLFVGDTGSTKTASSYLAMESVGAEKITIIGPARARATWPSEAKKVFKEDSGIDVFTINESKDLDNPRVVSAKYVFIGTELMARAEKDQNLFTKIKTAIVENRGTDGIIIDEAHVIRNPKSATSKVVNKVVTSIRNEYEKQSQKPMPIIALTATPVSTGLMNLDVVMSLLYPQRFSHPFDNQRSNTRFSYSCLRNPEIARSLLHGEKLFFQLSLTDLFGEKAPRLEYDRVKVPVTASQNVLNEWIIGLSLNVLSKIGLLEKVLIDPEYIKPNIHQAKLIPEKEYSDEEFIERINQEHTEWMKWTLGKDSSIPNEPFSEDWIAKHDRDFYIQFFFHKPNDFLLKSSSVVRRDWYQNPFPSPKVAKIMEYISNSVITVDGRQIPIQKIMVISPNLKRGITRNIIDDDTPEAELEDDTFSLLESILLHLDNLPQGSFLGVDGNKSFPVRLKIAKDFIERGDLMGLVLSMRAVYESQDWAVRANEQTKNIQRLLALYLTYPWGYDSLKQMSGRYLRPGLGKDAKTVILEAENTSDEGRFQMMHYRYLFTQLLLAGVIPSEEDRIFFDNTRAAKNLVVLQPRVGQVFLRDVFRTLNGRGEEDFRNQMSGSIEGRSLFDYFAQEYYDNGADEWRIVGHNAELSKTIALKENPDRIISIGAGSCLFARKIVNCGYQPSEIENVDINGSILRLAQERHPNIGNIKVEGAASLSASSGAYDVSESGFLLPLTRLYDDRRRRTINDDRGYHQVERVKAIIEMNRVLRPEGTAIITVPDSSFDLDHFSRFCQTLQENFGFTIVPELSGMTFATDIKPLKRIGWIITLKKSGEPRFSGLNIHNLTFLSDELEVISRGKEDKNGNGNGSVVHIDYPIFSPKQFEVRNPLTGQVKVEQSLNVEHVIFQSQSPLDIKYSLGDEQLKIFNRVRRKLMKSDQGLNYEDAELRVIDIITRNNLNRDDLIWFNADGTLKDSIERIIRKEVGIF